MENTAYWIISDKLEYGTYTSDRATAAQIRKSLLAAGADDVRIECETEIFGQKLWYTPTIF